MSSGTMKRRLLAGWACFLALLFCLASGTAEKKYVTMGSRAASLPRLTYDDDDVHVYDYVDTSVPAAVIFTSKEAGWYTFSVTNHSLNNQGFSIQYGLLTRVFVYNTKDPSTPGEELYSEYLCTRNGKAYTTTFSLRLAADTDYMLNFNAVSTSSGTLSFSIVNAGDDAGDSKQSALRLEAGSVGTFMMNAADDDDYFLIPAQQQATDVTMTVTNRLSNGSMSFTLCDSFNEVFAESTLKAGASEGVSQRLEAGVDYYVVIRQTGSSRSTGRYMLGWCDGVHHAFGAESVGRKPTCEEDGERVRRCGVCGETQVVAVLPATGHRSGAWKKAKTSTCIENGYEEQKCEDCRKVLDTRYLPLGEHKAGKWETLREPTCTAEGQRAQNCSVCGYTMASQSVPALGHSPSSQWETLREATCTAEGQLAQYCTACGITLDTKTIPALGHSAGGWVTEPATCTKAGRRVNECTVCGTELMSEEIAPLGHEYGDFVETKKASMFEEGEQQHTCRVCGFLEVQTLPKLGLFEQLFGK